MNRNLITAHIFWMTLICAGLALGIGCRPADRFEAPPVDLEVLKSRLALETEIDPKDGSRISRGAFAVFENRTSQQGRMIHLDVVILHAISPTPRPDPLFFLAGGPGADITQRAGGYRSSWIRENRDIVLVSQRGTGGDNRLDCTQAADDNDLQGYLDPLFDEEAFRACLEQLKREFDLTQYSTCQAADDLNDIRRALDYDRINLSGTSYGTRMALVYMRRHPETVRTAVLNGVLPMANKNPLYHSPSGQSALEVLFADCADDPDCREAFPDLQTEFKAVMTRLEQGPVDVSVTHPVTEERVPVKLSKAAFAEALRTMMYFLGTNAQVPLLIHEAYLGNFEAFAQNGVESNRSIRRSLALGMLLCVTCAEDIARVEPGEIERISAGSFLDENRIHEQIAICEFWPRSKIPDSFGDPVQVDVPVLLLSGTRDPVTPPRWGAEAARHLPNSLHLVVPGAHGVGGPCIRTIVEQLMETGSVEALDVSCTRELKIARFRISKE